MNTFDVKGDVKGTLPGKAGKAPHHSPPLYPRLPAPHCRRVDGLGRTSASSDPVHTGELRYGIQHGESRKE